MSVVDYAAWKRGYMPPTEHLLIHELSHHEGRVVFRSCLHKGSINIVLIDCGLSLEALEDVQFFLMRRIAAMKRAEQNLVPDVENIEAAYQEIVEQYPDETD